MKQNTEGNSTFSKLDHIAIVVRDLDKAVERLSSLGMGPFKTVSVPPTIEGPTFRGKPLRARTRGISVKTGDAALELIEPTGGESTWQEFLDNKGEGIHHVAFHVDNIEEEAAKLIKKGCLVIHRHLWQGGGCYYFDVGLGGPIIALETIELSK
jgi:methylmalonyl-CoA/ethylmalonyl-CoA epimerase